VFRKTYDLFATPVVIEYRTDANLIASAASANPVSPQDHRNLRSPSPARTQGS